MSSLISCQSISKSHGSRDLFLDISVTLSSGERIGLIGPNGAGKSTFLKLLAGLDTPDSGEVVYSKGLHVGYVTQDVEEFDGSIEEAVAASFTSNTHLDPYAREAHVRKTIGELGFSDPTQPATELSGGWKRRLSIAKALVNDPDVLLLDEPTNHLDLDSILWMETFLQRTQRAFIVTSHDRVFLDNVSTKIWDLSHRYPGGMFVVDGAYAEFLEQREAFFVAQKQQEKGMRSKMRREEEWLRQTPKARTTKSRARIQEAARLRHDLAQVKMRNKETKANLSFGSTGRQNKKLITAKSLAKSYEGRELFSKIEINLNRGDRLGIVGENGSGKSTLMKIIAGEIKPDSGTVKYAEDLEIFYFDQHREQLDITQSLRRGLAPEGETVNYRGNTIHVNAWCERFLFTKDRLDLPMKNLSGGERARVMIARLMLKSADVLFLDEPTNDLDIETLELLEESLDEFPGAVVLISHDRAMMDRVADKMIALGCDEEDKFFNDTEAWLKWRKERQRAKAKEVKASKPREDKQPQKKKLTYKEKIELEGMEDKILKLEGELEKLTAKSQDPAIMADSDKLQKACAELSDKQHELDAAYHRWEELEAKK